MPPRKQEQESEEPQDSCSKVKLSTNSALQVLDLIAEDTCGRNEIVRHAGIDLMFAALERYENNLGVGSSVTSVLWKMSANREHRSRMLTRSNHRWNTPVLGCDVSSPVKIINMTTQM